MEQPKYSRHVTRRWIFFLIKQFYNDVSVVENSNIALLAGPDHLIVKHF